MIRYLKTIFLLLFTTVLHFPGFQSFGLNNTFIFDVAVTSEGPDLLLNPCLGHPAKVWQPITEKWMVPTSSIFYPCTDLPGTLPPGF